jgi:hypothetical protein
MSRYTWTSSQRKGFEIRTRSGVGRSRAVHGMLKFDSLASVRYANESCITMKCLELVLDLLFCNPIPEWLRVNEEGRLERCV